MNNLERVQEEPVSVEGEPAKIFAGTDAQLHAYYDGLERKFDAVKEEGATLSEKAGEMFAKHEEINKKFAKWNAQAQNLLQQPELTEAQREELRHISEVVLKLTNLKHMLNEFLLKSNADYELVRKRMESVEASDTDSPERN